MTLKEVDKNISNNSEIGVQNSKPSEDRVTKQLAQEEEVRKGTERRLCVERLSKALPGE